ncbi:MAG: hypothetical protein H0Z32_11815 [Bacillaceae bacterium]|nr:hypothetical protein [Bacillaceae bacterium]
MYFIGLMKIKTGQRCGGNVLHRLDEDQKRGRDVVEMYFIGLMKTKTEQRCGGNVFYTAIYNAYFKKWK